MKRSSKTIVAFMAVVSIAAPMAGLTLSATPQTVQAAKGDLGPDWSKYQGMQGQFAQASDKFVIAQVGGTYGGSYVNQATYKTQVAAAIAAGKRAHTYIWFQVGGSTTLAAKALDHFLPMVQTPKGSIIALDYEAGASSSKQANTDALVYALGRIKTAGYQPMVYSGKAYMQAHVNWSQIVAKYGTIGWIARYPSNKVTLKPNYKYFPSLDGVAMWQFSSSAVLGGLDYSVDLTGITDKGYGTTTKGSGGKVTVKPKTTTSAVKAGEKANATKLKAISKGYTVKVNFSAKKWATGAAIPSWVRGKNYKVAQVSGSKVLLSGILSWINRSDVEILQTSAQYKAATPKRVVQKGTWRARVNVYVRSGASVTSAHVAMYHKGETVKYDSYVDAGGIRWCSYIGASGKRRYVARRTLDNKHKYADAY
jgi:GH25 family lysozyme M1 (1,4-beta-N-acetylmuramidase)